MLIDYTVCLCTVYICSMLGFSSRDVTARHAVILFRASVVPQGLCVDPPLNKWLTFT